MESAVQGSDYDSVRELAIHCEEEGINLGDLYGLKIISNIHTKVAVVLPLKKMLSSFITKSLKHIPIWASMLIGAILMLVFQVISLESAVKSINLDVIGFLFGIVTALDKAGLLKSNGSTEPNRAGLRAWRPSKLNLIE
jgi:hypothetical protein